MRWWHREKSFCDSAWSQLTQNHQMPPLTVKWHTAGVCHLQGRKLVCTVKVWSVLKNMKTVSCKCQWELLKSYYHVRERHSNPIASGDSVWLRRQDKQQPHIDGKTAASRSVAALDGKQRPVSMAFLCNMCFRGAYRGPLKSHLDWAIAKADLGLDIKPIMVKSNSWDTNVQLQ